MGYNDYLPERQGRDDRRSRRIRRLEDETAKKITDEVRYKGLMGAGVTASAGQTMEHIRDLDDHRKALAGRDEALAMLLSAVEKRATNKLLRINDSLFETFD